MFRHVTATVVLLLTPLTVSAVQPPAPPATAAEQYAALAKAFHAEAYAFRQAATDQERAPIVERANQLTLRLLALAQAHPKDPAAIDALTQTIHQEIWLENNTTHPGFGADSPQVKAIAILLEDHIRSDKIAETTRRVQYGFRPECQTLLRAVVEKNPHRELKGLACLRLAQFLNLRRQRLDLLRERPKMLRRYQGLFGKEYVDNLLRRDQAEVLREVEAAFERAAQDFADVKLPFGDMTIGQKAASELYELRHLSVGKPAPNLAGTDQHGQPLTLADFRGKVVLLYFWSEY
jgi:hypothetical protein